MPSEACLHPSQKEYYPKIKENPNTLLVEMQIVTTIMENNYSDSPDNKPTILSSYTTPGDICEASEISI